MIKEMIIPNLKEYLENMDDKSWKKINEIRKSVFSKRLKIIGLVLFFQSHCCNF